MTIFVSKLNYTTQGDNLKEAFGAYGLVSSAQVVTDKLTGRSKGFGFVEMSNDEEAKLAIQKLHLSDLDGKMITVKQVPPRK